MIRLPQQINMHAFAIILMGILLLIICYTVIGSLFQHKKIHIIHQTGVGILIGLAFGFIMVLFDDLGQVQFNQQLFFYALLPPIIFAGGYNLKKRKFFQNFTYIIIFGLLGTLVTFGIILGLTFLINNLGLIRTWKEYQQVFLSTALIVKFSATICATDSVAALTIIKPEKYPKLFSVVFGQGMVNDAVAIILFKVVGGMFDEDISDKNKFGLVFGTIGQFILTIIISLSIGVAAALLCTKLFKQARYLTHNPVSEVIVIYLFGIMSYVAAQILQMSGVITVLVCGISLAHFNFYNLSITGQLASGVANQSISFVAQAFVFVYLGISTVYYLLQYDFSYTFVLLEIAICFIGRFGAIFGLTIIFKFFVKKWKLSMHQLLIVSLAGTIRGSVAFALILTIDNSQQSSQIYIVKSSVLIMVFITTIVLGALMPTLITCILSKDPSQDPEEQAKISFLEQQKKKQKPMSFVKMIDQNYLKPFFIYKYRDRKEQIKQYKRLLKLNSGGEYKGGEYVTMMKAGVRQSLANQMPELRGSLLTNTQKYY